MGVVMAQKAGAGKVRNLVILFGDQLDAGSAAFDGFDQTRDVVAQMEVGEEAEYVPQHKMRLAFFFSAMRHFREDLEVRGIRTLYVELDDPDNTGALETEIIRLREQLQPESVIFVEPGDWRVAAKLKRLPFPIDVRPDRHFLCSSREFASFLQQHPRPIMGTFYRHMRRSTDVLMDGQRPVGGAWNFDSKNRKSFGRRKPDIPAQTGFGPDAITQAVVGMVAKRFPDSPGKLDAFRFPVTRSQALHQLHDFVGEKLPFFGEYQDAMLGGEWLLYHSHLSGPLNLHLLNPREVIAAALENPASAPLNSLEGFVRQIIGWREFVRGIYWQRMPHYADENALDADLPMPAFYWTGETEMRCLAEAISHTIDFAYAHHIERLMVLGLFAMLLGVRPYDVHLWHMSMFWDAIDWVSLPNTLGMSQHGDGGVMGTKPYAASGSYIDRMSDHCRHCRYDPKKSVGDDACPFTTLYWAFLAKHRKRFRSNERMKFQLLNLDRKDPAELLAIAHRAEVIKAACPGR
jgi:deoxyribodipyrimidine photolyase-related protein